MDDTFMKRMKAVSEIMKEKQEKHGHDKMALPIPYALEIEDFIKLVRMAEQKEKTDRINVELFDEIQRLKKKGIYGLNPSCATFDEVEEAE